MRSVRLGAGAGYAGDRIEPAIELAERGEIDYLVFECLAERTIALAQQAKLRDPERRLRSAARSPHAGGAPAVPDPRHPHRHQHGRGQSGRRRRIGPGPWRGDLGLAGLRIAAVTGDDVLDAVRAGDLPLVGERRAASASLGNRIVSANAYLGAAPIVAALADGAESSSPAASAIRRCSSPR